jgi:hypothetical protein
MEKLNLLYILNCFRTVRDDFMRKKKPMVEYLVILIIKVSLPWAYRPFRINLRIREENRLIWLHSGVNAQNRQFRNRLSSRIWSHQGPSGSCLMQKTKDRKIRVRIPLMTRFLTSFLYRMPLIQGPFEYSFEFEKIFDYKIADFVHSGVDNSTGTNNDRYSYRYTDWKEKENSLIIQLPTEFKWSIRFNPNHNMYQYYGIRHPLSIGV